MLPGRALLADDTELLLLNPEPVGASKPNILFILDSSGSMATRQATLEPYDANKTYVGACDNDTLYWTDVDVTPDCETSTNLIDKNRFHCAAASRQLRGVGSFTDTLAQYGAAEPYRWQYLAPDLANAPVECQSDYGQHGDGRSGYLWPSSAGGSAAPYTNNPLNALSWGSAPRNLSYTVYDGNYLNWRKSPATTVRSRAAILKEVLKSALNSVDNLNVGLMRFNGGDGGAVIHGVTDLDANRQSINAAIDSLPTSGVTPLSETLYEAALYWRGMQAYYGQPNFTDLTDANALASHSPTTYAPPELDVCVKNFQCSSD